MMEANDQHRICQRVLRNSLELVLHPVHNNSRYLYFVV